MARAHDIERSVDLLLASVDQRREPLRAEAVTSRDFAQRFDEWLRPGLAAARCLGYRLAPPLQPDAGQHRLTGDGSRAGKLVVESQ